MSRLDENRKIVAESVRKFEKRAQEIHALADKLHQKMEKLHMETTATRERARATRKRAQAAGAKDLKRPGQRNLRKAG